MVARRISHPPPDTWRLVAHGHDLERVHDRNGVGELVCGGGFEAGEAVARRLGACSQPLLEGLFGAAFDHVQQPGRAAAVADRG